jgi:pyruvate dehydrogenase E1 component alpha subunit
MATKKKAASKTKYDQKTYMYWYESMQLQRRFEEKAGQLYGQQKIRRFRHSKKTTNTSPLTATTDSHLH